MEQDSRIFISYRREDSSGYAGRLHDALSNYFGSGKVFMDVEGIGYGADFVEVLENELSSCAILIAVIGKRWVEITNSKGQRRLEDPQDFVHLEIVTALKRGIRVIPTLVQDAMMPGEDVLPPPLAKLSRRNAIELSDTRWKFDVERLIVTLERELDKISPKPPGPPKKEALSSDPKPDGPVTPPPDDEKGILPSPAPGHRWLKPAALAVLVLLALGGITWLVLPGLLRGTPPQANPNPPSNNNNNDNRPADPDNRKLYGGTINNREQLSLSLGRRDQFLFGTISNHSTRRFNIKVQGTIDNQQNIVLQELDANGVQTGTYKGTLKADGIDGYWTGSNGGQRVPFHLKEAR